MIKTHNFVIRGLTLYPKFITSYREIKAKSFPVKRETLTIIHGYSSSDWFQFRIMIETVGWTSQYVVLIFRALYSYIKSSYSSFLVKNKYY